MKILIFYPYFEPAYMAGGPIQSLKYLLKKFVRKYETYLVTSCYDMDGSTLNVKKDTWCITEYGNIFYSSDFSLNKIRSIIDKVDPNILYLNSFFSKLTIKVLWVTRSMNVKTLIAPRGEFNSNALNGNSLKKRIYIYLFKLLYQYRKYYWHFTNENEYFDTKSIISITNYFISGNLHIIEYNDQYFNTSSKKSDTLKIVSVSRINTMKNIDFLIKSLKPLSGTIVCDIYGEIEDKIYFKQCLVEIEALNKNIKVEFKGSFKPETIVNTICNYDLYYSPSKGENFGHAILEGLIAGLPALISNKIPFFKEIETFEAGCICNLNNMQEFTHKLEFFCKMDNEGHIKLKNKIKEYLIHIDKKINSIDKYIEFIES